MVSSSKEGPSGAGVSASGVRVFLKRPDECLSCGADIHSVYQWFLIPCCGADQDELFFPGSPHGTVLRWGGGAGIHPDLIPTWNLNMCPGKRSIYSIQDSKAQLISVSWNPTFPKDSEKGSRIVTGTGHLPQKQWPDIIGLMFHKSFWKPNPVLSCWRERHLLSAISNTANLIKFKALHPIKIKTNISTNSHYKRANKHWIRWMILLINSFTFLAYFTVIT